MLTLNGRNVYIVRGKGKSDTVNICDANNRRGEYDWTVRIFKPTNITETDISRFQDVNTLVSWLIQERSGSVEKQPDSIPTIAETATSFPPKAIFDPRIDTWTQQSKWIVEHTLDLLVHEFIHFPYLHRVEHSLHARLFSMLSNQSHFMRLFPVGTTGEFTQTIHKEWPETKAREAQKRGNFDIGIVAPAQLQAATLFDFKEGRIPAHIVMEMGLDYNSAHLAADEEKLINSAVTYPYLLHFVRECRADENVERILLQPSGSIKTVYVRTLRGEIFFKLLNDLAIQRANASVDVLPGSV